MPLRDHFRSPVDDFTSWEGFHAQWPAVIVQQLRMGLPAGYAAEPRAHLGSRIEFDLAAFDSPRTSSASGAEARTGGIATAVWAPPKPNLIVETMLPDYDEYEVKILDIARGRRLVAAIEIVSTGNKDRPEARSVFVAKCAALLQKGIAISIVDLVTVRYFNLYFDLLAMIGHSDPTISDPAANIYAASCRWTRSGERTLLEAWSFELAIGNSLPKLPLWIGPELVVPLDLEESYEKACSDLGIV